MARIAEDYRSLLETPGVPLAALIEKDIEFHLGVAMAAKNGVSYAVMQSVIDLTRTVFQFIPDGHRLQIYDDMVQVLEALRAKDGSRAAEVLVEHIRVFNDLSLSNAEAVRLEHRPRPEEGGPAPATRAPLANARGSAAGPAWSGAVRPNQAPRETADAYLYARADGLTALRTTILSTSQTHTIGLGA